VNFYFHKTFCKTTAGVLPEQETAQSFDMSDSEQSLLDSDSENSTDDYVPTYK
jgi:hypothetical protein